MKKPETIAELEREAAKRAEVYASAQAEHDNDLAAKNRLKENAAQAKSELDVSRKLLPFLFGACVCQSGLCGVEGASVRSKLPNPVPWR
jgi:hypothetical protein